MPPTPPGGWWGSDLRGLQIFGLMGQLGGTDATTAYEVFVRRFPGLRHVAAGYRTVAQELPARFFRLTVLHYEVLDEAVFGRPHPVMAFLHGR